MTSGGSFQQTAQGQRCGDIELVWAQNSKEFFFANSIVVYGREPIIVDPSANYTFFKQLASHPSPKQVVNTHYHSDHRALNGLFSRASFACHASDAPALRSWQEFQQRLDANKESVYSQWVERMWQQMHLNETPVTRELNDGDLLETDTTAAKVIHIPGHTPGLIALLFEKESLLFTSDIDLTPTGPWYANEVSDLDQFEKSVRRVRAIEVDHYVTSHGQRIYDRETFLKKLDKFESTFARRDEKIIEALTESPKLLPN